MSPRDLRVVPTPNYWLTAKPGVGTRAMALRPLTDLEVRLLLAVHERGEEGLMPNEYPYEGSRGEVSSAALTLHDRGLVKVGVDWHMRTEPDLELGPRMRRVEDDVWLVTDGRFGETECHHDEEEARESLYRARLAYAKFEEEEKRSTRWDKIG
jgi:hypothetical protein